MSKTSSAIGRLIGSGRSRCARRRCHSDPPHCTHLPYRVLEHIDDVFYIEVDAPKGKCTSSEGIYLQLTLTPLGGMLYRQCPSFRELEQLKVGSQDTSCSWIGGGYRMR